MLIPCVQGDREKAPRLPFEALFAPVRLPNGRCAPAVEDIDQRLVDMPLRTEAFAGRDTAHVSIVDIARTVQHDIDSVAPHAVPPLERNRIEVLNEKSPDDIDSL